jgi:CheY-like chemotaxis protein
VLVAEDEPEIQRAHRVLLEDMGFDVVIVGDGLSCLEAYRKGLGKTGAQFDLVILDYRMPGKNGIEVANEIAAMAPSQKLLMITAYEGIVDHMQKPKNMTIMAKPYDIDELIATIERLTQKS